MFTILAALLFSSALYSGGLKPISVEKLRGDEYALYDLSGDNKPNGMIYRFRQAVEIPPALAKYRPDIADSVDGGYLMLERESNAAYLVGENGEFKWEINLAKFVMEGSMEVQDIRYDGGILYFNAACQSYGKDQGWQCSSLYAVDPTAKETLWKSRYLVSNNIFLVLDRVIVAGYGFTSEPDYLYIIDKKNGKVLTKTKLDSAHSYLELKGRYLHVLTYSKHYVFDIGRYL